ncbi:MAG TPA: hypothetical protein VGQ31_09235 [Candidatus Limnocylindrales bacterium]|jgi:hypothetical protein|nr:hypothetical protein [Candidatus Limnocylindrales bacterium]
MARHSLRIVIVLGMLITLVGGTGIFAVFSDRATTGPSDVTTTALGKAADLKIAAAQPQDPMNSGPFMCADFVDDLSTPLFDFTASTGSGDERFLCVRNDGSSAVDLTTSAIDIVDTDTACTGDEAAFGDTTCGEDATTMVPQQGELSPNLTIETDLYDCSTGSGVGQVGVPDLSSALATLGSTPEALGSLPPGGSICVRFRVFWRATGDAAQVSQSDEATWRFAFDGTVPSN